MKKFYLRKAMYFQKRAIKIDKDLSLIYKNSVNVIGEESEILLSERGYIGRSLKTRDEEKINEFEDLRVFISIIFRHHPHHTRRHKRDEHKIAEIQMKFITTKSITYFFPNYT